MTYRIRHITEYNYNSPVSMCYNLAHHLPRDTTHQTWISSTICVLPQPTYASKRHDYFDNLTYYFSVDRPHKRLIIDVTSEIKTLPKPSSFDLDLGLTCHQAREILKLGMAHDVIEAREYMLDSPMIHATPALKRYAEALFTPDRPLLSAVSALSSKIYTEFAYDPSSTSLATPLKEVLKQKRGVCQDFAHLAIGCLRALDYPARYVSGYLETLPPPGEENLIGADASHACYAVYSPGEGWFEFDPTNNNMPSEQHITTAWGRDYSDVTPLQGVIFDGGGSQTMKVSVDVQRVGV